MFNSLHNQTRVLYRLEPVTGLLIKSGKEPQNPTRPDMEFIRTLAEVGSEVQEVPFLPGSSIKGAVRSHAERILRTLGLHCCDITRPACVGKGASYRDHCLACRTFGYTTLSSRVRFTDAFPWRPDSSAAERSSAAAAVRIEQRPGVQIDRRLGSAAGGRLFELEVATSGAFYGEIVVRNYQLWQLGLLALVVRDINEGYQRVGAMKSRGLGRVKMGIEELRIEQWGPLARDDEAKVRGIGFIQDLIAPYDLVAEDAIPVPTQLRQQEDGPLQQTFLPAQDADADAAWRALAQGVLSSTHWQQFIRRGQPR